MGTEEKKGKCCTCTNISFPAPTLHDLLNTPPLPIEKNLDLSLRFDKIALINIFFFNHLFTLSYFY